MLHDPKRAPWSVLLSFKFLGTAIVGFLIVGLVCTLASASAQLAIVGVLISILGGLLVVRIAQKKKRKQYQEDLIRISVPVSLTNDTELLRRYEEVCRSLTTLAENPDSMLRSVAMLKLSSIAGQIAALARGSVIFDGTEDWHAVYEQMLRNPDIYELHAVAWVRSKEYWQDEASRRSMEANFEVAHQRMLIDRIVVVRDELWTLGDLLPSSEILPWIERQHNQGLRIRLVRESDLASEPELLIDMSVYGDQAVSILTLDDQSRTLRFVLDFNSQEVRVAQDRWERISRLATPFRTLLERLPDDE